MVQTILWLGAWNRLKAEYSKEEVARFLLLERGFLLVALSGVVPILAWLTTFGESCLYRFGGDSLVGEMLIIGLVVALLLLIPLQLLGIVFAFAVLVRTRFYLSLALLQSSILISTTYPVVHVKLLLF